MSRFRKLSQTLWHCQYHIVWCPKYRFRILEGQVGKAVEDYIRAFSEQQECEIVELNVQPDHVHLLVMIPPKISVSDYVGKVNTLGVGPSQLFDMKVKVAEKRLILPPILIILMAKR